MNIIEKIESLPSGLLIKAFDQLSNTAFDDALCTSAQLKSLTTALQAAVEALELYANPDAWDGAEFIAVRPPSGLNSDDYDNEAETLDFATEALTKIHALIGETKGGE
jgi:hypothetical protein